MKYLLLLFSFFSIPLMAQTNLSYFHFINKMENGYTIYMGEGDLGPLYAYIPQKTVWLDDGSSWRLTTKESLSWQIGDTITFYVSWDEDYSIFNLNHPSQYEIYANMVDQPKTNITNVDQNFIYLSDGSIFDFKQDMQKGRWVARKGDIVFVINSEAINNLSQNWIFDRIELVQAPSVNLMSLN